MKGESIAPPARPTIDVRNQGLVTAVPPILGGAKRLEKRTAGHGPSREKDLLAKEDDILKRCIATRQKVALAVTT